jgi:hypothetical protein
MRVVFQLLGSSIIIVLAVGLTIASLQFIRPVQCQRVCVEPAQAPCPDGACRFREQRAGFPFPMVQDGESGGSPTGGEGTLGAEDYENISLLAFFGNVLFYGMAFWLLVQLPHALRSITARHMWVRLLPALVYVGAGVLVGFVSYRPSAAWHPPPATVPPTAALLGTWRGTEPTADAPIFVRFYAYQQVMWSASFNKSEWSGDYRWVDDRAIEIHFVAQQGGTIDMCTLLPTVLVSTCRAQLAASPQPRPVDVSPSPTPTQAPYDNTFSSIDVLMTVRVIVDETTLTLQSLSGHTQTFERVTGK